jgi:hypothetical protein
LQWLTPLAQVTLKENASAEELTKAKDKAKADGGQIKHEFTLIKGFTYVCILPDRNPVVSTTILTLSSVVSSSQRTKSEFFRPTTTSTSSRTARSRHSERRAAQTSHHIS